MNKYHYTYILIERNTGMRYIGVRSCDCIPKEDNYWGSSKHLPNGYRGDLTDTFDKVIVELFETRGEANEDEIRLHNLHDVAVNPMFYNRAKATSKGFCVYGTKASDETLKKIRKSKTGDKHPMYGKQHSGETRTRMSKALLGDKNPMYGKQHSNLTRNKMSKSKMGNTDSQKHKTLIWWKHKSGTEIFANPTQMRDLYNKGGETSDFAKVYKGTNKSSKGWSLEQ